MRTTKILISVIGLMVMYLGSFAQEAPDSIAKCEPEESPAIREDTASERQPEGGSRVLAAEEVALATDSITSNYDTDWTDISMQGKLTMDGLPMSVSVKVYMRRGESIILSARAPFLGEVARLEANADSITLINKHTRTYNVQSLQVLPVDRTAYLRDLQDVLLGEVAFPGYGRLSQDNAFLSQWLALPTGETLIYPGAELQTAGTEYGFVMDSECWELRSFVLMLQQSGVVIETKYLYGDRGWTLGFEVSLPNNKKIDGKVELSYPEQEAAPMDFTKLGGKYRKVDFKQLMKF